MKRIYVYWKNTVNVERLLGGQATLLEDVSYRAEGIYGLCVGPESSMSTRKMFVPYDSIAYTVLFDDEDESEWPKLDR